MPQSTPPKIGGYLMFIGVAVMAAALLAEVTHDGLGISRHIIRKDALLTALLTFGLLLIGLFSHRLGSRK